MGLGETNMLVLDPVEDLEVEVWRPEFDGAQ